MLKIHHPHSLNLPQLHQPLHRLQLSRVTSDGDELIKDIESGHEADTIQLEEAADSETLGEFWTGVEDDLKKDPTWFDFAED